MIIRQLNHVALHVADVKASSDFYERVLGLKPLPRPAFSFDGAWFEIAPADGSQPAQELHLIAGRDAFDGRIYHWAMRVDSIEDAAAHLRARQVNFAGPSRRPDGAMQIFLRDPDGHVIEFCVLPPLPAAATAGS